MANLEWQFINKRQRTTEDIAADAWDLLLKVTRIAHKAVQEEIALTGEYGVPEDYMLPSQRFLGEKLMTFWPEDAAFSISIEKRNSSGNLYRLILTPKSEDDRRIEKSVNFSYQYKSFEPMISELETLIGDYMPSVRKLSDPEYIAKRFKNTMATMFDRKGTVAEFESYLGILDKCLERSFGELMRDAKKFLRAHKELHGQEDDRPKKPDREDDDFQWPEFTELEPPSDVPIQERTTGRRERRSSIADDLRAMRADYTSMVTEATPQWRLAERRSMSHPDPETWVISAENHWQFNLNMSSDSYNMVPSEMLHEMRGKLIEAYNYLSSMHRVPIETSRLIAATIEHMNGEINSRLDRRAIEAAIAPPPRMTALETYQQAFREV